MSIQIGDIDLAKEIIDLHYQVRRLQFLLDASASLQVQQNTSENLALLAKADQDAFDFVQKKFPNMGIKRTAESDLD